MKFLPYVSRIPLVVAW